MVKKSQKKQLSAQYLPPVPLALVTALAMWGVVQQYNAMNAPPSDDDQRLTSKTVVRTLAVSYLYADYWMWMLHCFLDRPENLNSKLGFVRSLAEEFQIHHHKPVDLLSGNHLASIGELTVGTAVVGLLLGAWTSAETKITLVLFVIWGSLGGLNHYYCHAATNGYNVPALYRFGQKWGLLPSAKHHKIHHTSPFDCNWNFLNGLHAVVYEPLYSATGASYWGMAAQFYALNPAAAQFLAVGAASLFA